MRVLYVLNAVGGGASLGIYEMLRTQPSIDAYAVVPYGGDLTPLAPLFRAVRPAALPWWNRPHDPLRGAAIRLGERRRGVTEAKGTAQLVALIREWGIDLVHTGTAMNREGALAAQQTGTPHLWHIKEGIGRANRVQFPLPDADLVGYISGLSAGVVAMSAYVAGIFQQHHCPNLTIIPDGVDLAPYLTGESRALRAHLGIAADTPLIGMVAGLSSTWKRHDLFIEMAGRLAKEDARAQFVIIGGLPRATRFPYDVPHRYAQSMLRLAREQVAAGRLTFLEHVPNPPDIMRSLDVLVHPCDIEPFGRVAIEAMAAGTPVIGTTSGGIAETVIDSVTGLLVAPNDPAALAAAARRLIEDADLRRRLGEAGKVHVSQHYGIDLFTERMLALYRKAGERR